MKEVSILAYHMMCILELFSSEFAAPWRRLLWSDEGPQPAPAVGEHQVSSYARHGPGTEVLAGDKEGPAAAEIWQVLAGWLQARD